MPFDISPELQQFIDQEVTTGRFPDRDAVPLFIRLPVANAAAQ